MDKHFCISLKEVGEEGRKLRWQRVLKTRADFHMVVQAEKQRSKGKYRPLSKRFQEKNYGLDQECAETERDMSETKENGDSGKVKDKKNRELRGLKENEYCEEKEKSETKATVCKDNAPVVCAFDLAKMF